MGRAQLTAGTFRRSPKQLLRAILNCCSCSVQDAHRLSVVDLPIACLTLAFTAAAMRNDKQLAPEFAMHRFNTLGRGPTDRTTYTHTYMAYTTQAYIP